MLIVIEGDDGTGKDTVASYFVDAGFYVPTYEPEALKMKERAHAFQKMERTLPFLEYSAFCGNATKGHERSLIVRYWMTTIAAAYVDSFYSMSEALEKAQQLCLELPVPDFVFFLHCDFDERIRRIDARQIDSDDDRSIEQSQKYDEISHKLVPLFNWHVIDTTNNSPENEYNQMLSIINSRK